MLLVIIFFGSFFFLQLWNKTTSITRRPLQVLGQGFDNNDEQCCCSNYFQGKKHGHSSRIKQRAFIVIKKISLVAYKLLVVLCFVSTQLVKEWKMNQE